MTTEKKGYAVQKDNIFINSDEPDTGNVGTLTNVPYTYTFVLRLFLSEVSGQTDVLSLLSLASMRRLPSRALSRPRPESTRSPMCTRVFPP